MKIAHLCLSCFYIDNYSYQENILVQQNIADSHQTIVIASTETINKKGEKVYVPPKKYHGTDNAIVYRLPYSKKIPRILQNKVRSYQGVLKILNEFNPDIIYFHGISAYELLTVRKFKVKNPNVKVIVDVHSDHNNSARNWLSKNVLHKSFYKSIFQLALPYIDKIYCCSLEAMDFAIDVYNSPIEKCEFYPLGGVCLEDQDYYSRRSQKRKELNIKTNDILILQTGKFDSHKKLIESLKEFSKTESSNLIYIVAGSFSDDIEEDALNLISKDQRIKYVGWVNSEEIKNYLCASDLYIQPGSQSATMQQSLCLRNPVILNDVKSHRVFVNGNGWLIRKHSDIYEILEEIIRNPNVLERMSSRSYQIALEKLDYRKLAKKIYDIQA